ncbi:TniQ family protein [Tropicimonas sp. TH_r6]|uniref:TniQ family protein n=1 Tax=Tropicimonas sp. TH_r6 TaxID=3082085 RepID=UPI00295517DF|nr:TniQ family protein [Tropicimonas sp. TH_r6]MDV7144758.1 TniQ family protein [Tropicimonas sp. TH_r6]
MLKSVPPRSDESLLWFLRRVSRLNAYPETSSFLSDLGFRYGRKLLSELDYIAGQIGVDAADLRSIAPANAPDRPALDWKFDRLYSDPVCPSCLLEGGPSRLSWRNAMVSACCDHGIRLQDECPRCHEQLTPNSGGLETCSCGFRLKLLPVENAPSHEIAIARLIENRLQGDESGIPAEYSNVVPVDVGRFLHFLASGFAANRAGKEGFTKIPRTVSDTVALFEPVAPLLKDWPEGFRAHVKQRLAEGDPSANSAPGRLGNWYQRLMKFDHPGYEPYRSCVADVIAEAFDGTYAGANVANEQRVWIPATEAAKRLGVRNERIVAAVTGGKIGGKFVNSGLGHRHTIVHSETIEELSCNRRRYRSAKDVQEVLGVASRQFQLLVEAKVFTQTPCDALPALVDGRFDLSEIRGCTEAMRGSATPHDGETVAFRDLNLRRTTDRAALFDVFRAIFDGSLKAASAPSNACLGEFQFPSSEIEATLRQGRHSIDWTAHDVAKITGWKHQVVTQWCRLGLIDAREVPHGRSVAYLVSPEDLARFQSEFVPLGTLAKARQTTSRKLLADFAVRGVPTFGSETEGSTSRGHLVRLGDLAVVGRELLEDPTKAAPATRSAAEFGRLRRTTSKEINGDKHERFQN